MFSILIFKIDNRNIYYRQAYIPPYESQRRSYVDALEASRLITDEYSSKILVATFRKPKSMLDISREYGIPAAACYRRLHSLEKAGLIKCVRRELTEKGKMQNIYSSQLKNAHISLDNGRLRVRFTLASGLTDEFGGDWSAEDMLVKHGYDGGDGSLALTADISDESSGSFDAESSSENAVQSKKEDSTINGEAELVERAMHELERVVSVTQNALRNIREKAEETQRSGRKTEAVLSGTAKVADAKEEVASKTKKRSGAGGKE